ncbi:hypothetical protein Ac2012v2_005321 [Leucoagaricus gongylophorus]
MFSLLQRYFSIGAFNKGHKTVSIGSTRKVATDSIKKRRTQGASGFEKIFANSRLVFCRANVPAWASHIESFRHRSHGPTTISQPLILLGSAKRSATHHQLLHEFARKNGLPVVQARHCKTSAQYISDIEELVKGNKTFRSNTLTAYPMFFEESSKGQKPPYMLIDCSDSRVAEQAIFDAQPGTMFTSGSIANQFHEWDLNSNSVLSYAIETLGVRHVIVMGHYGCGGVAASMLPVSLPLAHPAHIAVQTWIQPIREIYQSSTRPEIVAHRNKSKYIPLTELPDLHDPALRALVEENVKANVNRIAGSYVMRDHYASLPPPTSPSSSEPPSGSGKNGLQGTYVFIHGWVYDLENGEVTDLNVSLGPPGREIPKSPWPATEERERQKRIEREAKEKARP